MSINWKIFKTKTAMLLLNQLRKQKDAIEDIPYVWSIAMYGCETWTIGEAERKRLEASKCGDTEE